MITIAYNKDNKKILGFISTDYEINPEEVFGNFENYEVVKTEIEPPLTGFKKYEVDIENGELKNYILKGEDKNEETSL